MQGVKKLSLILQHYAGIIRTTARGLGSAGEGEPIEMGLIEALTFDLWF